MPTTPPPDPAVLVAWLDGLGLVDHLHEQGLLGVEGSPERPLLRDLRTGELLSAVEVAELDAALRGQGEDPAHAVPVDLLRAAREARLRAELAASATHDYASLAALRGTSLDATRFWVTKTANAGTLLAVAIEGETRVPAFQLTDAGIVRPEVEPLLAALLGPGGDPWRAWIWLTQPAALLGGAVPHEAAADPDEAPLVAHAARRLATRRGAPA